jgi:hypothetical protein
MIEYLALVLSLKRDGFRALIRESQFLVVHASYAFMVAASRTTGPQDTGAPLVATLRVKLYSASTALGHIAFFIAIEKLRNN